MAYPAAVSAEGRPKPLLMRLAAAPEAAAVLLVAPAAVDFPMHVTGQPAGLLA